MNKDFNWEFVEGIPLTAETTVAGGEKGAEGDC